MTILYSIHNPNSSMTKFMYKSVSYSFYKQARQLIIHPTKWLYMYMTIYIGGISINWNNIAGYSWLAGILSLKYFIGISAQAKGE